MHGLNEYDFSARWQDAANPGFTTMDPLAEMYNAQSPYMYCGGDPVNRIDPTGMNYVGNGEVVVTGRNLKQERDDNNAMAAGMSYNHDSPNSGTGGIECGSSDAFADPISFLPKDNVNKDKGVSAADIAGISGYKD